MEYTTRMVRSVEGLTQEQALVGLQSNPQFVPGTRIASVYNQGGRWVAKLLEPKTANEDIFEEDIEETPAELHEEKHEKHEKSESPLEEIKEHEDEKHEDSEEKKINELEKKIDLLLEALGISEKGEKPEVPEVPEAPAADMPAAPKGGPSKSDPLPPGSGAKLKPGEIPNKPGMTPVGAPAFASVKTAGCEGSCEEGSCEHCDKQRKEATSVPPNASMDPTGGAAPAPSGPAQAPQQQPACSRCGGADANCPQCGAGAGQVMSFTASRVDSENTLTIRQAKAQLENEFNGFRVARIKRDGDAIHALLTHNDS